MKTKPRELPMLANTQVVQAILAGRQTQDRRPMKENFIYSLTGDRIYGILTGNDIFLEGFSNGQTDIKDDTNISKRQLQGGLGWTYLLSNEIQGLWEEGLRGLVSVKRVRLQVEKDLQIPDDYSLPQRQENNKNSSSVDMYGFPRDAEKRILNGETFGWEPRKQQAGESQVGNSDRELGRQESSRQGNQRRKTSNGKTVKCRVRAFEVGNQGWSVQPATGSKGIKTVSGWNISYSPHQINSRLYVRERIAWDLDDPGAYCYYADEDALCHFDSCRFSSTPNIHMKKRFARIWLEVTRSWIERNKEGIWEEVTNYKKITKYGDKNEIPNHHPCPASVGVC